MRSLIVPAVLAAAISLGSCAGTDAGSGSGRAFTPDQKKSLRLSGVTAETARNVEMNKETLDRIVQKLTDEVRAEAPNVFAPAGMPNAPALTMKLVFTDYQGGGDPLKFERRSVGVIRIDADILFLDPNGRIVAQSKVAEHFGSGGDVGLTTNVQNVEAAFESAVAALVR